MITLALFGAGGHGKVVADSALQMGWKNIVFFDDTWPSIQKNSHWPVIGDMTVMLARLQEFDGVLVSIGHCQGRWEKHQKLKKAGAKLATVIHPRSCVSSYAKVGVGTVVMPGAVINVDAEIGEACIVNTGATVGHDCALAHGVHICPGANLTGNVSIGLGSWVGVSAAIRQGMHIGANVTVGAGAVVVKHVPDGVTVVGNPAAPLLRTH